MPPPLEDTAAVERRYPVAALGQLCGHLASALGEAGLGGAQIASVIQGAVHGECLTCGIRISGDDLMSAGIGSADTGAFSEKQRRLQLGDCARNHCRSSYYLIHLNPHPGIDWIRVWERSETLRHPASAPRPPATSASTLKLLSNLARQALPFLRRPSTLAILGVLSTTLFIRQGCRVPLLSPKPRVFIVPTSPPPSAPGPISPAR